MGRTERRYPERDALLRRMRPALEPRGRPLTPREQELARRAPERLAAAWGANVTVVEARIEFQRLRSMTEQGAFHGGMLRHCNFHQGGRRGRQRSVAPASAQEDAAAATACSAAEAPRQSLVVSVPPEPGSYACRKQMRKAFPSTADACICRGCLASHGRMWMVRGTGSKAKKKGKGMARLAHREIDAEWRDARGG